MRTRITQRDLGVSSNRKFLFQYNRDGKLFVYNLSKRRRVLSGMSVDNEMVVFDDTGYYDSTPEGAHYVYWLFRGRGDCFAFSQFQSRMYRPDIIKAILRGEIQRSPPVDLTAPPSVDVELLTSDPNEQGQVRVKATAEWPTALKGIRLFVDGMPLSEYPVAGKIATAEGDVPITQGIHWVTAVGYDSSGYSSVPKSVRVNGQASPLPKGRLFYV